MVGHYERGADPDCAIRNPVSFVVLAMTTRFIPKTRSALVGTLAAGALLFAAAACSDSKSTSTTTAPAATDVSDTSAGTETTPAAPAGDAGVILSDTSLGKVLTNASGMPLYLFTPDSATASTCNAGCDTSWPPVAGPVTGGEGLDAAQFTTITRDDGSTQAAYYGHPLYLFAGDTSPGDVTGQGVGGKWYAITAEGGQAG